ncbi:SET domain-containing protein [Lentinula raphanica]|nr:SET domain-containing protein [Lentinula raphanica]
MSFDDLQSKNISLEAHPVGRSKCVARNSFTAGSTILSNLSFVDALLPSEKGHRCDYCHHHAGSGSLKKCTGCASFYYCDQTCQNKHWKSGHRKICKTYNSYTSASSFQALDQHKKMDALLLSGLVARVALLDVNERNSEGNQPFLTFQSLLPGPMAAAAPPINPKHSFSAEFIQNLYSRFENNNHTIHSHFVTHAHGIFPLASRSFNHSCMPNAGVKFVLQVHEPVKMEIVALRAISIGDEICIPYIDPALLQTRMSVFDLTYGFTCFCPSCNVIRKMGNIPEPPKDTPDFQAVCKRLREFVGTMGPSPLFTGDDSRFPKDLACVLHESFISTLSEQFSAASHDGQYDVALDSSASLTALYQLLYPPNYPQIGKYFARTLGNQYSFYHLIGLHFLEKAKSCWNHSVRSTPGVSTVTELERSIAAAREVLTVIGNEGDPDNGPLVDLSTLSRLYQRQ